MVLPLPFGPAWSLGTLLLTATVACMLVTRHRHRPHPVQPTWGCGFRKPTARMAYTAGGFTQFAQDEMYYSCLRPREERQGGLPFFPAPRRFHREYLDPVLARWFSPLFAQCADLAHTFHRLQAGQMNFYLTYIFLATVLLLGWSFLWQ
jgi:hypothetical protein